MSTQKSRNKTNRKDRENTDWLDKLINELSRSDISNLNSQYI